MPTHDYKIDTADDGPTRASYKSYMRCEEWPHVVNCIATTATAKVCKGDGLKCESVFGLVQFQGLFQDAQAQIGIV